MADGKLSGKQFCFTGAIERMDDSGKRYTRDMIHSTVLENGGKVTDKVSSKDVILVQANPDSVSSKSKKAQQVGATIMSEADFWRLVA